MTELGPNARVYVAGHGGLVGSAVVRRLAGRGLPQPPHRHPRPARPARPGRRELLVPGQPPRVRVPGGRHGGRHPGQLHPARRVHLRQHDDPRHGGARRPPLRREEAALPGQLLHLPARVRAAHQGGVPPHRACSSPPTSPTPWPRSRASSSARPTAGSTATTSSPPCPPTSTGPTTTSTSQSSHVLPALIRKFHDARVEGRQRGRDLGHGDAAPRVPARGRPGRRLPLPHAALRRGRAHQRGHGRGPDHPRAGGDGARHRPSPRRGSSSTPPSPTARRASSWTSAASSASAGGRASGCATAWPRPTRGSWRTTSASRAAGGSGW